MDLTIIAKINTLWEGIYPPLASFVARIYGRQEGDILELGPFAGGIAQGLLARAPGFKVVVASESALCDAMREEDKGTPCAQRMMITPSPLVPLVFLDQGFDLVVCRGAFFFLTPALLQEIYRVLRPNGIAIVGGGYGPDTPQELIKEIAAESKELNLQLGKQWMTEPDLTRMINEASLSAVAEISRDGGLWVILRKSAGTGKEQPGLAEALTLRDREVISLVGAGGKTSLMFALARELQDKGRTVITTTTTKISEPLAEETPCVVIEADEAQAIALIKDGLARDGHCTFAARRFPGGKIGGADPAFIERLAQGQTADYIIVEADGARRLPIKAPGGDEPVIPAATTLLVPIVGIDALDRPLNNETAFRPERIAELIGARLGEPITAHSIARLMVHPQGLCKGALPGVRIIPFINKVETTDRLRGARQVAHEVLQHGRKGIERVVLSRLFFRRPIVEIMGGDTK
jgi:probable selenium-dependent hydroxylase accessory protein YqeC